MSDTASMLIITGPTASGKTKRAVEVAQIINGEIISADSRQLYRGMDIGTGKDLAEYKDITYHMIDICPAGYKYNLYEYLRDFDVVFKGIVKRGKFPILCGGTGLYIESVINGLRLPEVPENPELRQSLEGKSLNELKEILSSLKTLHNITDVDTIKRAIRAIEIQSYYIANPDKSIATKPNPMKDVVIVGIDIDRENRRNRISNRLLSRIDEGMIDEVRCIIESGVQPDDLIYYGLEYKYVTLYITGKISYSQMCSQLEIAIHQFAKRQMTWFRGMERRGFKINWLPWDMPKNDFVEFVIKLLKK